MLSVDQYFNPVDALIVATGGDFLKRVGFCQGDALAGLDAQVFPFENLGGALPVCFHVMHGIVDDDILALGGC